MYINNKTKVKIWCNNHGGYFYQAPSMHLSNRHCPICAAEARGLKSRKPKGLFIKKAIEVHGNKYDYSNINYIKDSFKINIFCPIHKTYFSQAPQRHLRGNGCPKCGIASAACKIASNTVNSFKLTGWKQLHIDNPAIFYILKCWDDTEIFYKIGITCRSVKERYRSKANLPYNYEIINQEVSMDRDYI